jgi:hypothetical protein
MNMLGRLIPLKTARKGGYFFTMSQSGVITATLDLGSYFTAPDLPVSTDWLSKAMPAIKRMYCNDSKGCCVISSLFHIVGLLTGNELGTPVQGADSEVLAAYGIWNPGRQDNGCDISAVNAYWRDHGITVNGEVHKIDAFVSVDNTNKNLVKAAIDLFGNVKLGIDLPGAWEQVPDGGKWDVTNSRVVGGHDVPGLDFSDIGPSVAADGVAIATWGGTRTITWPAFTSRQYITEAYTVLAGDWYSKGAAPNGIDVATLKADLDLIAKGQIPSVGPPSVPIDWLI